MRQRRRGTTCLQVACKVSLSISSQIFVKFFFKKSMLEHEAVQAFCSKIDHMPKFMGLRSRDEGAQSSLDQTDLKLFLHQSWTILAVWEVAISR